MAAEPTLYGRYEYIALPEIGGEVLKAKMDTGALTASLSAKDIETFTRDGEDWVRFRLGHQGREQQGLRTQGRAHQQDQEPFG